MTGLLRILGLAVALTVFAVHAADPPAKLQSLRGETAIDKTPTAEMYKQMKDSPPLPREFAQQPPLIPHTIRDYQITRNFNKCMDCHAASKVKETGATKVSPTHFMTREGQELANISPARFFCTQCHVGQTDTRPLVESTFRPSVSLR